MMAFVSVWMGLGCLIAAITMLIWRQAFTDFHIWLVLWLGAPGTMCLAGLVLWSFRNEVNPEPAVVNQRLQCKVAIGMAFVAVVIVYVLIFNAEELDPDATAMLLRLPARSA